MRNRMACKMEHKLVEQLLEWIECIEGYIQVDTVVGNLGTLAECKMGNMMACTVERIQLVP